MSGLGYLVVGDHWLLADRGSSGRIRARVMGDQRQTQGKLMIMFAIS
jgi:hypothetical protein